MGKGGAGSGPWRTSPELGQYWGEVGAPHSSTGWGGREQGGQPHGLNPFSRTALLPQPPYGVLLGSPPQEGGGGHILPRMGGLPVAWGPGVPPEPGGSAQLPLPPLPRRYQVHLPGSCSACQQGWGLSPIVPHGRRGAAQPPPHGTGTAGAAEGVPEKGSPVSPPLTPARTPPPCSDAPPWQRCTPSSRALTPRETLRQMVLTPAPCPGCSPFAHGGPGAAGWGGLGSLPWDFS